MPDEIGTEATRSDATSPTRIPSPMQPTTRPLPSSRSRTPPRRPHRTGMMPAADAEANRPTQRRS